MAFGRDGVDVKGIYNFTESKYFNDFSYFNVGVS